jgi:hypothetical protein
MVVAFLTCLLAYFCIVLYSFLSTALLRSCVRSHLGLGHLPLPFEICESRVEIKSMRLVM